MPPIRKAIVPMAGRATRLYPLSLVLPKGLIPFVLPDNTLTTGLHLIVQPLLQAGIDQIGLVVSPDTVNLYERFLSGEAEYLAPMLDSKPALRAQYQRLQQMAPHITLIAQNQPYGLGHAVWCAYDFAKSEPVVVALGDHVCVQGVQVLEKAFQLYERYTAPIYTVHTVPLDKVSLYGILQGQPTEVPFCYRLDCIVEKPTPEFARAQLHTPGFADDQFLAHYGVFLFPDLFWEVQAQIAKTYSPDTGEWQLVHAQQRLLELMPAYLLHTEAPSLDFGTPEEYRDSFLKIAHGALNA
ncbi:MAG: sugar phosphate nucleotidyltransferase [Fimbriimonadales bacterium]